MKDIYPIKDIFTTIYPILIALIFLGVLLSMIIYSKLKNKDKNQNKVFKINGINPQEKVDIRKLLNFLEKNIEKFDENDFYKILYYVLCLKIEEKYKTNIKEYTVDEIKRLKLPENIKALMKEIYFKIYKNLNKNLEERKKYLNKIKEIK